MKEKWIWKREQWSINYCVLYLIDEHSFSHREFSFALEDDVYVRYQSYESREGLEEGIKKKQPYKIDIGAIFSHKVYSIIVILAL